MKIELFGQRSSILRILSALPRSGLALFDLALSSVLVNILMLALPLILMQAFDRIIPNHGVATLAWLVFGGFIAILLEVILRIVRAVGASWSSARLEHVGSCLLVDRILSCRIIDFEKFGVGVHLDRINALATLRSFLGGQVFQLLMDIPFVILFLTVIWFLAGKFVILPISLILLYVLVVLGIKYFFRQQRGSQIDITDRRYNFLIELLGNIHIVKALGLEELFLRRYERLQKSNAEANMRVAFWSAIPNHVGALFGHVVMFSVLLVGGLKVASGEITLGTLVAISLLSTRSLQPIQGVMSFWLRFAEVELAQKQLAAIAELPSTDVIGKDNFPQVSHGNIELQQVAFQFSPNTTKLFKGINLKINHGEIVVIVPQHSGSGATTLLHLLGGVLTPTDGSILVEGMVLSEWDTRSLKGIVEFIPQQGRLFHGTIIENITMFQPALQNAALDAAALMRLDELVAHLPQGYETIVTSQSNDLLPSGLIQRIAVARALVVRPRILLVDKTEMLMDQDSAELFIWLLTKLKGRCTIVMVSRNPAVLSLADRLFIINNGQLKSYGGNDYV